MMKKDKYYISNEIRLLRSAFKGSICIVEGLTDANVFKRFFAEGSCKIIPAMSDSCKEDILGAVEILEKDSFKGFLAIVDSDFWKVDKISSPSKNVLQTDTHDLETMIIKSKALDRLIGEYVNKNNKKLLNDTRNIIIELALPIGYLRWLSSPTQKNWALKFKGTNYLTFIDFNDLKTNTEKMVQEINYNSGNILDNTTILSEYNRVCNLMHDKWQVCQGHDLVVILWRCISIKVGNKRGKQTTYDIIDSSLRLAFDNDEFRKTELFMNIKKWQKENKPYVVF